MPNSLVIEGLAQTGGLLVCEVNHFAEKVILAKIPKVEFFCEALPGDTLTYTATIQDVKPEGAAVTATSHKGNVLHAQAEIVFAHLNDPQVGTFLRRKCSANDAFAGSLSRGSCGRWRPLAPATAFATGGPSGPRHGRRS